MTGRCGGATSTLDLPVRWKVKACRDELRKVPAVRIGELAERAGISAKAIRYYEQIGVLTPPTRTPSGYRDYDHATLGRLAFVRAAQAVGLTLGEIRQVVAFRDRGQPPCEHVAALLQRRAAELDARLAELQQLRGELDRLARRAATLDPQQCPPERVCHVIA
jgi:MerR family transcriptional regulator, copper efflux regulator